MGKRPNNKIGLLFYRLGGFFAYLRMMFLEGFYAPHIRIRYLHDKTYEKGGAYKRWTDKPYSQRVHKLSFLAFFLSFAIFSLFQSLFPYLFNPVKPQVAKAGSKNVTWTTDGDLNTNNVVGPDYIKDTADDNTAGAATTKSNITVSGNSASLTSSYIWSTKAPVPGTVIDGSAVYNSTDGKIYVLKGWTGVTTNPSPFYRYNPSNNEWETLASRPYSTLGGGMAYNPDNGKIYSTTGTNAGSFFAYDVGTNTWSSALAAQPSRSTTKDQAVYVNGKVYVPSAGALDVYDIAGNSWSVITPGYTLGQTVAYNPNTNKLYFTLSNSFYSYDLTGGTWAQINPGSPVSFPGATIDHTGSMLIYSPSDNALYGKVKSSGLDFVKYDFGSNSWSALTNLPTTFNDDTKGFVMDTSGNGYLAGYESTNFYKYSFSLPSSGYIRGIKLNAEKISKWATISWSGTALPANSTIKLRTRGASTLGGLNSATWDGTGEGSGYITFDTDGHTTDSSSIATPSSKWIEVELTLESGDTINGPTIDSVTVTFDTLEEPSNSNITLTKTTGDTIYNSSGIAITAGIAGGYTNETAIKVSATGLICSDCGTSENIRPEIEVKELGVSFDETGTVAAESGRDYAITTGLNYNVSYHIQVRAIDDQGRASGWTSYGNNAEDVADFTIERSSPTGSVTINNGDIYTKLNGVDLTISASDTGGSNLSKMRFSNYGSSGWSNWEDYATSRNWVLAAGADGVRTVYAQFKDNAGNTSDQYMHTTKVNFDGGTHNNTYATANGDLTLGPTTGTLTIQPDGTDGIDLYTNTYSETTFPNSSELWNIDDGASIATVSYLKFAGLSNIPVGATINSATLYLTRKTTGSDNNVAISLQRADSSWDESTGFYDFPAGTSIGNYAPNDYVSGIDVKSAVEYQIANGNYGFVMARGNLGYSIFYSSDHSVATERPKLVINYTGLSGPPYASSGTLESATKDHGGPRYFGAVRWGSSTPSAAGADAIKLQLASNNDNATWNFTGPDGAAGSYYTTSGTQIHSSHNGNRYMRYKIFLSTTDTSVTPVLTDTNIEVMGAISDVINIDKTAPANVTNLKAYTDAGKGTELSSGNWYQGTTPYFEWDANGEADLAGYKYCFSTNASCDPTATLSEGTTSYASDLGASPEGAYSYRVVAYDDAGNTSTPVPFTYGFDSTAPIAVTGFNAPTNEATETTITLHWDQAVDNGSDITGYILERKRYDAGAWSGPTYALFNLSPKTSVIHTDMGLDNGFRYNYRIKAINGAGLQSDWATLDASTVDTKAPTDPSSVVATACDGTAEKCSNIANKGFEIKLSWMASSDTGVGLTGYKIYRRAENNSSNANDFILVGYLDVNPVNSPITTVYYDNDTNNDNTASDATKGQIKNSATTRLNDYTTYHYRIVAMDENGINSDTITTDPLNPLVPTTTNYAAASTPDVTGPAAPTAVSAAPTGIDNENNEPPTQGMYISWTAPQDLKAAGRLPEGNGRGVSAYEVWRAIGNISGPTESFAIVPGGNNVLSANFTDSGLNEDSYYWYKIKAKDVDGNLSALSTQSSARTKNSQVPTTPSAVNITAKTGDPNTDSEVGQKVTITFNGSKIVGSGNRIDGYRIYRSTSNLASEGEWTALTPVHTFTGLNIAAGVQDGQRSFTDTVPTDSTTYYYKVVAYGWNQSNSENVDSGLSSITPGTPHSGWDTVPDGTAPNNPGGVAVKDIHGNSSMVRNIVTWQVITTPLRNGANDFARYEIYRFETNLGIGTAAKIAEKTDIGENYHVDGITVAEKDKDYSYYVVAVDNAATQFKYPNNVVINAVSNISGHEDPDNINPGAAYPYITSNYNVSGNSYKARVASVGVSSAVIEWTTDQNADSLVEYRRAGSSDKFIAAGDTELRGTHQVTISSLSANTAYEYRIRSVNNIGNKVEADGNDVQPVTTANFSIANISVDTTTTTAAVKWTTGNVAADSSVEYKIEAIGQSQESKTAGDPTLATSHEVVVLALKPDTNYTYKIRSVTADKYVSETAFLSFRTKPYDASQFVIAPNASNVAEQNITATTAKIVWNTAIATTTWVDYGTSAGAYNQSSGDDKYNTVHVVELLNLTPGNTYYYRVRGVDASNVEYTSKEYSFTAVLKPQILNLKAAAVTAYTAKVSFSTNVDTEASVSFGKDGNFDLKAGTSEVKRGHEISLENLEDGTDYTAIVEVRDKLGNTAKSSAITFKTPVDTVGPTINGVKIDILPLGDSDETAQAIISWATDKPSTTKIEYDEGVIGAKYSKSSVEDQTLNSSHTVIIRELTPGTTYRFRIVSKNKRGIVSNSNDFSFVTPNKEKSVLQLIIKSLEETFSWVKNVGSFLKNVGNKAN